LHGTPQCPWHFRAEPFLRPALYANLREFSEGLALVRWPGRYIRLARENRLVRLSTTHWRRFLALPAVMYPRNHRDTPIYRSTNIMSVSRLLLACIVYGLENQSMASHQHDGRVPSGFLLGATHKNGCTQNGAVTQKSLFSKEYMRPDAKRTNSAKQSYHGQCPNHARQEGAKVRGHAKTRYCSTSNSHSWVVLLKLLTSRAVLTMNVAVPAAAAASRKLGSRTIISGASLVSMPVPRDGSSLGA
jgi:hypothetical protein